ncbi:Alpha-1,3-arabinosyltransferase XAT3 [Linum perenne]
MSSDDDEVEEKKTSGSRPYHCKKGGRSEFCDLEGDIRIDPFSPTVYYVVSSDTSTNTSTSANHSWSVLSSIKPYARNEDRYAMASVREWSVVMVPETHEDLPFCNEIHDAAGVIFSFGGYAGNHFHTFSDVLIPLFATSHPFKRQVELLVTDNQSWLIQKFKTIMQALSSYDVVDIDREQQAGKSHCFSRLILGLKGRQMIDFGINSSESAYTMRDFKKFLRSSYSLNKTTAIKLRNRKSSPQLLIISRDINRLLTNVDELKWMATKLGYNVTVAEFDLNVSRSAEIMNPCDVVIGVHGAGLANMVFLADNAVVIQVVPFATDWFAKKYEPSKDMNVRYVEYKIKKDESSLKEKYALNHDVFTNPTSFQWNQFKPIFFDNQNVKLDLKRFKLTLLKALALLWEQGKPHACKKTAINKI